MAEDLQASSDAMVRAIRENPRDPMANWPARDEQPVTPEPSRATPHYAERMSAITKETLSAVPERIKAIARGQVGQLLEEADYLAEALAIMHDERSIADVQDARNLLVRVQRRVDPDHFDPLNPL